jgi:two-component system chemotaxis response regulator CheB
MQLLAKLPAGLPAIVGVVLHRSPHIESRLPFVLGRRAAIKVVEPASGDLLEQGVAYVPPRDQHLIFQDGRAYLSRGPREHLTRPPSIHSSDRRPRPSVLASSGCS